MVCIIIFKKQFKNIKKKKRKNLIYKVLSFFVDLFIFILFLQFLEFFIIYKRIFSYIIYYIKKNILYI